MPISYPKESSKFDLAAELFWRLRGLGFIVAGGVKARAQAGRCVFDLVAFNPLTLEAMAIIEVEEPRKLSKPITSLSSSRRIQKYQTFGLPIYLCNSYENIEKIVQKLLE